MFIENWKCTEDGLWIGRGEDNYRIGFLPKVMKQMENIMYIEVMHTGDMDKGEPVLLVETLKAIHEFPMPLSGKVTAMNDKVINDPELLNGQTWIIEINDILEDEYSKLVDYKLNTLKRKVGVGR